MCPDNNNGRSTECECFSNIINVILKLQSYSGNECSNTGGCDKPFLGPTPQLLCFNTRPITFYKCCDGTIWTLPYTLNGTDGTSSVFRVEGLDGCCVTVRILALGADDQYVATNSYATINLNCVGALQCLSDIYVACQ